ncbi:GNAT family N-acetyltransferase [Prevotella sp. 10(H)]|uniref:GNAT family N-acetyltransferase n=1 Tax=Prevotella sp. 10(H) TaxID=1158294 RepID=UPI0004A73BCF|nr:GNAT family N-acetyltransferase [Prevotella sp. 10(H)]
MIRNVNLNDAKRIAEIYNYYIENTIITFEYEPVTDVDIMRRIEKIEQKNFPFFVYEERGIITGYAYFANWRERAAYDITMETSVYLDHTMTGHGTGSILYQELIERARRANIHSLIGVVSLPNPESQKLHRKFNFELIGNFKEAGTKFGKLIDVEFWQLIL